MLCPNSRNLLLVLVRMKNSTKVKHSKEIGIGMLGCGVVGSGVLKAFDEKKVSINQFVQHPVKLRKIFVQDTAKLRDWPVEDSMLTTNEDLVIGASNVDVVVEVMGGVDPAYDLVKQSILNRKHVVTANKELMAKNGIELMELAEQQGVNLLFEASVGGGIPIVRSIVRDLRANDIHSIRAIINGTTNYILSRMALSEIDYSDALCDAQSLGYAESDPNDDVSGIDATYKLAVLGALAFRTKIDVALIYCEGIQNLSLRDFQCAKELGYSIKLLAIATKENSLLTLRVHPVLIAETDPLSKVDGVVNAVEVQGDLIGKVIFQGPGAGPLPTSSAVVSDILEISRCIALESTLLGYGNLSNTLSIEPISNLTSKYYFRLWVKDKPGVLAAIAGVFGSNNVSIASVLQKRVDTENQSAELVITTHRARESSVWNTVSELKSMVVVQDVSSFIRVEEHSD